MLAYFQQFDLDWFGSYARFATSLVRRALEAIRDANWNRAVVEPEPRKREYLPYDWRARDIDHAALPSYGVTAVLVLPRRFLEDQGVFLSQVRGDERVTLGDIRARLPDYEDRLRSRSGSPAGTGSAADEPMRSSSPPRVPPPRPQPLEPPRLKPRGR